MRERPVARPLIIVDNVVPLLQPLMATNTIELGVVFTGTILNSFSTYIRVWNYVVDLTNPRREPMDVASLFVANYLPRDATLVLK